MPFIETHGSRLSCALAIVAGWCLWGAAGAAYLLFAKTTQPHGITVSPSLPLRIVMTLDKWTLSYGVLAVGGTIALVISEVAIKTQLTRDVLHTVYLLAWSLLIATLLCLLVMA